MPKPKLGEVVEFRYTESSINYSGNFKRDASSASSWASCRDTFRSYFTKDSTGFFFSVIGDYCGIGQERVAEFVWHFEKVLKESGRRVTYSSFAKTSNARVMWVQPSDFWKSCELKRSLFTILLRLGVFYNRENFEDCLFGSGTSTENKWALKYIKPTRKAVERFMLGYTNIDYSHDRVTSKMNSSGFGWCKVFDSVESPMLEKILQSSSKHHKRISDMLVA